MLSWLQDFLKEHFLITSTASDGNKDQVQALGDSWGSEVI